MHRNAGQRRERTLGSKRHAFRKTVRNGQAQGQQQDSPRSVPHGDQPLGKNHEAHYEDKDRHRVTVSAQQADTHDEQAGWN